MSGTIVGGKKAAKTNLSNNPNFYQEIGSKGGKTPGKPKGFAANPELARTAGAKGGAKSSRAGVLNTKPEFDIEVPPTSRWNMIKAFWSKHDD